MKKILIVYLLLEIIFLTACQNSSEPSHAKTFFEKNATEIEVLYQYFVQKSKLDYLRLSSFGRKVTIRVMGNPDLGGKYNRILKTEEFKTKELSLDDKYLDNLLAKIQMPRDNFDSLVLQMKALGIQSVSYRRSRDGENLRYLVSLQISGGASFCVLNLARSPSGEEDNVVERNIPAENPEDGPFVVTRHWFAYRYCSM